MDKEDFEYFLNKKIGLVYEDTDKKSYIAGTLIKISDNSITIIVDDIHQVFSNSCIVRIKEKVQWNGVNNE